MIRRFLLNEEGATAIEYGILAAILSVGLIASYTTIKGGVGNMYNSVTAGLTSN